MTTTPSTTAGTPSGRASATSCAAPTCCATCRTRPSPTQARTGPPRPAARCGPSSGPGTRRARPALADIPADVRAPLVTEFRRAVRVGLSDIPRTPDPNAKQLPARNLLECLRDREHDVLRFCSDTQVPPTNNLAERDLRPHKTQQKISGRLQSENVTRDRLTIRGYLSTAAKNSVDAMTALRGAVIGSPWMPPVPIRA